jgi:glycerate dehydrogenase
MATMCITFMLTLSCSLVPQQRRLWEGKNEDFAKECLGPLPHFEIAGKTLGLIGGLGTIGTRITAMAAGLGLKVLVSSRKTELPYNAHPCLVEGVTPLDELLARSDFVSIHCPLSKGTVGLLGRRELALMKPSAYLINVARGAIVDERALFDALMFDTIAGAALDVHHLEPLPPDSPWFKLGDKVTLTPHIGWQRAETRQRLIDAVADNIKAFVDHGVPDNAV